MLGFFFKITDFFKTNVNNLIKILIVIFIFFLAYLLWTDKITINIYQEALTNIPNNSELIKPEEPGLPTGISEGVAQAKDKTPDQPWYLNEFIILGVGFAYGFGAGIVILFKIPF